MDFPCSSKPLTSSFHFTQHFALVSISFSRTNSSNKMPPVKFTAGYSRNYHAFTKPKPWLLVPCKIECDNLYTNHSVSKLRILVLLYIYICIYIHRWCTTRLKLWLKPQLLYCTDKYIVRTLHRQDVNTGNITVIWETKDKLVLPDLVHGLLQNFLYQSLNQTHTVNGKKK